MQELIGELVKKLGVTGDQAQGGAGLLFKLAQSKLGGDFSQVTSALSGVEGLIKAAPEAGGAAKLLGGLAGKLGGGAGAKIVGLAEVASGFGKLGLSKDMIAKFVPVVVSFAQSKGGDTVKALLQKVLA